MMRFVHASAWKLLLLLISPLIGSSSVLASDQVVVPTHSADRPLLKSIYAGSHQVEDFFDDETKAVAFVFISRACPVAQQYLPSLNEIYREMYADGVRFVAVYSNPRANIQAMAKHAHDTDINFPVMLDTGHRLADLLDVQVIPEVVVLDATLTKRYQGVSTTNSPSVAASRKRPNIICATRSGPSWPANP